MRIIFMGTPDFAVPSLEYLFKEGHEILTVFTQPDRPAGRGKQPRKSPVKVAAQKLGLTIRQPGQINTPEIIELLKSLQPELIIVVAYGKKLPPEILKIPEKGCLNVHASLLPAYRGAAPIHWAIINGETQTGITTMLMDEGLDTGDILLKKVFPVSGEATTGEVHDALAEIGGELLLETIAAYSRGDLKGVAQTGESSYAPLLKREHEWLDWSRKAVELHNQIRGLNPWPGAVTKYKGENLKIWQSSLVSQALAGDISNPEDLAQESPAREFGQVLRIVDGGIIIGTGEGELLLRQVQPAGKRIMPARDFFLGRHGQIGEKLGI
ncbi:MAG: methionyl-tRNA formyltransferase [Desulfitobacteriaceae bacterium]|nr:methionyl-tRNA formyltransferase [Desulfitobacteriaceae bacterium]MDD4345654.1 methionyl-tRNA formyltransferase [Desulfitobacteriaceae bacterium]MDD4400534.1 methionyl-tRNA formyltransferase [Desulfitobacteriaceae bacterium]